MKKLTDTMKRMLDALAFAHAGEHLSRREKAEVLNRQPFSVDKVPEEVLAPASGRSGVRRIALYLGSELPSEVMDYVIETCSRLQHELTILTFQSEKTACSLLKPHLEALKAAGVDMEVEALNGDPVSGLGRYLRRHPEVAFLACKDSGYLGRSYLNGTQRKNALPVPVVVVTTGAQAAVAQDDAAGKTSQDGAAIA